ncbi:MAG: lytic transglycosylase domain-containing protein [Sphingobacteriales bacterium]|nr:lytic transglycosylase domain-containing protein [Sphingobacteriales bacterium]
MKHIFSVMLLCFSINSNANQTQNKPDSCIIESNDSMKKENVPVFEAPSPKIQLNKFANAFVRTYIKENNTGLEKLKERSKAGFKTIDAIFTKYEIPLELKYLAVIESKLNPKATSQVGAKGYWQFMASTARIYGLKVKGSIDERTHQYKSTVAAAKYLKSLYDDLGDWLLVVAAYNSGTGYVYKAIKKAGSRDFWRLQYFLPKETRNHVKRFISVHYYFEGEGSETTLTKAEWNKYQKEMIAFAAAKSEANDQAVSVVVSEPDQQK